MASRQAHWASMQVGDQGSRLADMKTEDGELMKREDCDRPANFIKGGGNQHGRYSWRSLCHGRWARGQTAAVEEKPGKPKTQQAKEQPYRDYDGPYPMCPGCEQSMVLRQNREDGSWFLGCRSYPTCKETRPLADLAMMARSAAASSAAASSAEDHYGRTRRPRWGQGLSKPQKRWRSLMNVVMYRIETMNLAQHVTVRATMLQEKAHLLAGLPTQPMEGEMVRLRPMRDC